MNVETFLTRLSGVRRNGSGWIARCPAHEDHSPSLSIREGEAGRILIFCHAGCSTESVLAAIGLTWADVLPNRKPVSRDDVKRREAAEARAWRIHDSIRASRSYYRDGLHRSERLMARLIEQLRASQTEDEHSAILDRMARLTAPQTFFLAGYNFVYGADARALAQFALASPALRRRRILGDEDVAEFAA